MDNNEKNIKKNLLQLAQRNGPSTVESATVKAVNGDGTASVVLASGLLIDDARMKAIVKNGDELIVTPAIGSEVLVSPIDQSGEFIIIGYSEITNLSVKVGDTLFEVADKFEIKKGADTLKAIITDTIDEMAKIVVMIGTSPNVAALEAIKVRINQMFA